MATVTSHSDFRAQEEEIYHYFHIFTSICHEVLGLDVMIFVFLILSFKLAFSLSSFTLIKRGSLVPLHFLPLEWYFICYKFLKEELLVNPLKTTK